AELLTAAVVSATLVGFGVRGGAARRRGHRAAARRLGLLLRVGGRSRGRFAGRHGDFPVVGKESDFEILGLLVLGELAAGGRVRAVRADRHRAEFPLANDVARTGEVAAVDLDRDALADLL